VAALGLALVLGSAAGGRETQAVSSDAHLQQDVERSILVTVLDRRGAPVTNLTGADFAVTEDGATRTVTAAALSSDPLYVVVVVDTTQPPGQVRQILDVRDALKAFVTTLRAAGPNGKVSVIQAAGSVLQSSRFDEAPGVLDTRISRLAPVTQIESSVIEAIRDAGRMLTDVASQRRAIVSVDLDSVDPARLRPEEVVDAVERSRAAFWSISVRSSGQASSWREGVLNHLTSTLGGTRQTTILSRPLIEMLRGLARTLSSQYVLTYRRPASAPATSVRVDVKGGSKVLIAPWVD
jgi:hypothetical protein